MRPSPASALLGMCLSASIGLGVGCGASGAASASGGPGLATEGAAANAATPPDAADARGSAAGAGSAADGKSVPTEESPLPTGPVSTVEIPTPGEVNRPGGGGSAGGQVSPLCRDLVAGRESCIGISADYEKLHRDYCTFITDPGKGSEGEDLLYDPDKRAALKKLAATDSACCKNNVGDGTRC